MSHPTRVRGLKLDGKKVNGKKKVAPHTGAWIETAVNIIKTALTRVAPHTGAWIETVSIRSWAISTRSHPTRVRGLKPIYNMTDGQSDVAPHTGAWIETIRQ